MSSVQLMQGDCLERMKEIPAGSVDMVLTDPPYGISYKSGHQGYDRRAYLETRERVKVRESYFKQIANDDTLPIEWLPEAYRVLRDGGSAYVYAHWRRAGALCDAMEAAGFKVKSMVVVAKSNHGMGDLKGAFAPKHEFLIFAAKGRHLLDFPDGREKDVWHLPIKFTGSRKHHPNEKPLSWLTKPLDHSAPKGGVVLDPFMGSGSTGVACVNTGRRFLGIEIDPEYFAIAEKRVQEASQ